MLLKLHLYNQSVVTWEFLPKLNNNKYLETDTRHGIHITEKAGSYHMSYENWQINLKACQTLRSQLPDEFHSIWSSSVTRVGTEPASL